MRELWAFLRIRKKWWLGPIIVAFVILAVLFMFAEGSAVGPFIYTFF